MTRAMGVPGQEDLSFIADRTHHVLTLFSGGLDSSYLLYRLSRLACKVTALVVDLGEGTDYEELSRITSLFGASGSDSFYRRSRHTGKWEGDTEVELWSRGTFFYYCASRFVPSEQGRWGERYREETRKPHIGRT